MGKASKGGIAMPTTRERFHGAALTLVGAAPVKQRLSRAFREHLDGLTEPELPREIRQDFASLCTCLTRGKPVVGQSPVEASVRKLSEGEAEDLAARIFEMYEAVAESAFVQGSRSPALRAVGSSID
jgi:hypothetical protein